LGWYTGWFGEAEEEPTWLTSSDPAAAAPDPARHYLLYLSGVGAIAPNSISNEELPFIEGLAQNLPTTQLISDLFPYSVTNMGLTGQRITARVWRWIERLRLKNHMQHLLVSVQAVLAEVDSAPTPPANREE
jgi:hypothetical protein